MSHRAQLSALRSKWRFPSAWVDTSGPWQPEQRMWFSSNTGGKDVLGGPTQKFWKNYKTSPERPRYGSHKNRWCCWPPWERKIVASSLGSLFVQPEKQDAIWWADIKLQSLASVLYKLRKQLQNGSGDLRRYATVQLYMQSNCYRYPRVRLGHVRYLRVLIPDLDGPLHHRGVGWVDPVKQHHVGSLRAKYWCSGFHQNCMNEING